MVELEAQVPRAGEDVLRRMLGVELELGGVLGITWSRPRAPALEVAPGWNSDSTRATAVEQREGEARLAGRVRRRRSGTASGSGSDARLGGHRDRRDLRDRADGLLRPRVGDRHRSQAASERDDEEGSQPPRHECRDASR